jgi:Fic family protein
MFFFVSQSKPELAQRIERGLNIARQDGSFAALFEKYINFKDIEKALKLSERTVLKLNNPHLSEATLEATASEAQQFEVVK